MASRDQTGELISVLSADLAPVRRLPPPAVRAAIWLAAVALVAAGFYFWFGGPRNAGLFDERPYATAALAGAIATAVLAAIAAFQLSLPDRSGSWILLPLPGLLLWLAASGIGCLAGLGAAQSWGSTWAETAGCLRVIIQVSLPVSVLLLFMLRRAAPLRWGPVALTAGLAAAAVSGGVLLLIHPHDSTLLDLAVHAACLFAIVAVTALVGSRLFKFS